VQVKTKNMMFGALVVLMVGVLWYRVVYSPMEAKASKAKTAAHDADISSAQLRQSLGGTSATKKPIKNHDVATDVMLAAIPVDSSEAAFLRGIDELRVTSGAEWQSVTPTAPVVAGPVASINIGITVQGTEGQLEAYYNGLELMKRIYVIDNMSINGTPASASTTGGVQAAAPGAVFAGGPLQMQISGRIFAQPGAVASTGTTGAAGAGTTPVTSAPVGGGATAPSGVQNN
jgi:Tfp pilus assembly protein PilO